MLLVCEIEKENKNLNECSSCSSKHSDFKVWLYNNEKDIDTKFYLCKKCVRELREYLNVLNDLDKLK